MIQRKSLPPPPLPYPLGRRQSSQKFHQIIYGHSFMPFKEMPYQIKEKKVRSRKNWRWKRTFYSVLVSARKSLDLGAKPQRQNQVDLGTDGVRSSRGRTSRRIPGAWKGRRKKNFLSLLLVSVMRTQRHSTRAELAPGWGQVGIQGRSLSFVLSY